MSDTNGDGPGPVIIRLDSKSLATLMAGGDVDVPWAGIVIQAGGDAGKLIWDIRRRLKTRVTQKPIPIHDF